MNVYTYSFISRCPNDNDFIYYTAEIEKDGMIMVEDIIAHCNEFYKKAYQESIADDLFDRFGGKQTITAVHNSVKIKTIRQ